jgi:DNA-binding SARP family transcriptional activator
MQARSSPRIVLSRNSGQEGRQAAVGSLQNLVSDLRKTLSPEVVAASSRLLGYMLGVDSERVDLHRFQRLVAQAAEGGDAERRSALLRDALALWRGAPLAELAFEPFAHIEIARLEEMRTAAREELIEAELELGRHSSLVGELETLVTEHPLRERLRGQLMLALYRRAGRWALEHIGEPARRSSAAWNRPSPDLQRLEQSILRHDSALDFVERRPRLLHRPKSGARP